MHAKPTKPTAPHPRNPQRPPLDPFGHKRPGLVAPTPGQALLRRVTVQEAMKAGQVNHLRRYYRENSPFGGSSRFLDLTALALAVLLLPLAATAGLPSWEGDPPRGPSAALFPAQEPRATSYREVPHPEYPEKPARRR